MAETTAPGTERSRRSAASSKPSVEEAGARTKSAVCARSSVAFAAFSIPVAPSSEPASATVTSTGATTDAARRAPAATPSRTSMPVADGSRAGSAVSSRTSGPTRAGDTTATALISSIGRLTYVLRCSSSPGSPRSARTRVTAAVSSRAAPVSRRLHGRVPRSTAASRSACAGRTRPARTAAVAAPAHATVRPVQNATWYGHAWPPTVNHSGARSASTTHPARCGAPHAPSAQPAADASTPTSSASVRTSRRTWPGVAPTVRSRPSSRRRPATAKANIDATTNTETKPLTPPAVPNSAFSAARVSVSRSGSASASRRASPVSTRTPSVSRTARRTAPAGASTTSWRAAGERRAARRPV